MLAPGSTNKRGRTLQGDFERARFHSAEQVRLGNEFGILRLVYIDILAGDLVSARQTAAETIGIDAETRSRLALFVDATEDASLIPAYLEQIKQPGQDHWQITQELFVLGLYAESMRLDLNGP